LLKKLKSIILYLKTALGDTINSGWYEYYEPYVTCNSIFLFSKQRAQIMRYSGTVTTAAALLTKLNWPRMLEPVLVGCSVLSEHLLRREWPRH
jgi:hypothetical protein